MTVTEQAPTKPTRITRPGVYDLPEEVYHADPIRGGSLSSSGARKLLAPSCPALFRHEQDNPPPPKAVFDFGTAAHKEVLGIGPELAVLDYPDWRTKPAREARDEARKRGAVPLKRSEHEHVKAMAEALRQHPVAGPIFTEQAGRPEQSLFWKDTETGVVCRARLDHMPHPTSSGRLIIADYKTCASAAPDKIAKAVAEHGYHIQADWYMDGIKALKIAEDVAFLFVFQEKTAPYLVTVVELDFMALKIGAHLARRARGVYADCKKSGVWPGYHDHSPMSVSLPVWVEREFEETF